jgi:hypothetical protein
MAKTRRKDSILVIKVVTVMMFLAIIGVIIWTSIFISKELSAGSSSLLSQGGTGQVAAEGPNLKLLQDIEARLKSKVEKPLPDASTMRNPYLIPASNQNPASPPVQPPPVQPPAQPEIPPAPPATPTLPETPPTP